MRSMRTLLLGVLLVALAACGGGAASADESTGGEPSTATSASEPAATSEETPDDGGPGTTDIDTLNDELVPPNSHQMSKTELPQGTLIVYESTDTIGDLKIFYVQKLAELNMTVITTNDTANAYAVGFGTDDTGTGLGGTVVLQNAGDVTNVAVTLAEGGG